MNINATILGQALAFALLIWITVKYIWPPMLAAIEVRQQKIAEGLAAAERAQSELKDADARVQDEIRKARTEAAAIIEKAHGQANLIVDKAKQDAIGEANRQKSAAEAEIANLAHRAKEQLRTQVAQLAVAGARKIIQREINADTHKALIDQLVAEL
jgi:F-type H+-transporting ATPase subunit b